MSAGGVVLAGGQSSRMGTAKADLSWQGSTLLDRTCRLLLAALGGPVVVVRAPRQALPVVPDDVEVVADEHEGRGPVEGLAAGLRALCRRTDAAFVCATDLPFLHGALVRQVVCALEGAPSAEAVVPVAADGRIQPLAGAYRTMLADPAAAAAAAGRLRLRDFVGSRDVRLLTAEDLLRDPVLAREDPMLRSLTNVNDPQAYARALGASRG